MKKIKYGDFEQGIKEKFSVSEVSEELFWNNDVNDILTDLPIVSRQNPFELYSVVLDGTSTLIENDLTVSDINLGYWGLQLSDKAGKFKDLISLRLKTNNAIQTKGITIEFDTEGGVYSTNIIATFYLNGEIVSSGGVYPDKPIYFFSAPQREYDEILLSFIALNVPYNRLKIKSIEFGEVITFMPNEIISANISQVADISSITLPISTASIVLKTNKADKLNFQERQKIVIEVDGNVESTTYIKSAKRTSKNQFSIESEDVISLLESTEYMGGMYGVDASLQYVSVKELFEDILKTANVSYEIDDDVGEGIELQGHLPIMNCRLALQQVAFGSNSVILKSGGGIKIVSYDTIINSIPKQIGLGKMRSQTIDTEKAITSVTISAKKYRWQSIVPDYAKKNTIFETEDETMIGKTITIRLDKPYEDYEVKGGMADTHVNYVIATIYEVPFWIIGTEYQYDEFQASKEISSSSKPNPKKITGAMLLDYNNIDKLLDKCYNYYSRNRKGKMNIIDIDKVKIGDVLNAKAVYGNDIQGVVVSQSYSLVGNTFVKDTEIVGSELNIRRYGEGVYGEFVYGT